MGRAKYLKAIAGAPDKPLKIGGIEIPCYVLEDETRVLTQTGLYFSMGLSAGGRIVDGQNRMTVFLGNLSAKGMKINELLTATSKPIYFKPIRGSIAYGFPAQILPELCVAIIDARKLEILNSRYDHVVERADLLIRALATVGIIAMVDEVTGYQDIRAKAALAIILEKYIAEEYRPWTMTFPHDFYKEIFRLKGWPTYGPKISKKPAVIGHYTNDIVYERLAPGVLKELQRRNPVVSGHRKQRHHQWLTGEIGHPALNNHIAGVMALQRAALDWPHFRRLVQLSYPKFNEQTLLPLNDEIN